MPISVDGMNTVPELNLATIMEGSAVQENQAGIIELSADCKVSKTDKLHKLQRHSGRSCGFVEIHFVVYAF